MAKSKGKRGNAIELENGKTYKIEDGINWEEETEDDLIWEYELAKKVYQLPEHKKFNDIYDKVIELTKEIESQKLEFDMKDKKGLLRIIEECSTDILIVLLTVLTQYPELQEDWPLLKSHKYIFIEDGKPVWRKKTKSLAEYFGYQVKDGKKISWKFIEQLFNENGLKNLFSANGSGFGRGKKSKDYEDWLKIKKEHTPKGV